MPTEYPICIYESAQSVAFFKQDDKFLVPKGHIYLHLFDGSEFKPEFEIATNLWYKIFNNFLRETRYMAEMAYLYLSVTTFDGLFISIDGFNDSMHKLLIQIIQKLCEFDTYEN